MFFKFIALSSAIDDHEQTNNTTTQWCRMRWCKRTQKSWFAKNLGRILENLSKIPENPGKNGTQRCFDFKKWCSPLAEKHMKSLFEGQTKKRSSWSLWEKICRRSRTKTFQAKIWGNSGKNPSNPQKFACSCTCATTTNRTKWSREKNYAAKLHKRSSCSAA